MSFSRLWGEHHYVAFHGSSKDVRGWGWQFYAQLFRACPIAGEPQATQSSHAKFQLDRHSIDG